MKYLLSFLLLVLMTNVYALAEVQRDTITPEDFDFGQIVDRMTELLGNDEFSLNDIPQIDMKQLKDMEGDIFQNIGPMFDQFSQMLEGQDFKLMMPDSMMQFFDNMDLPMMDMDSIMLQMEKAMPEMEKLMEQYRMDEYIEKFGQLGELNMDSGSINQLMNEMKNEGLITEGENTQIELTDESLTINGKQQSKATYEKYKTLYQELTGTELGENFAIKFHSNDDKPSSPAKQKKLKTRKI